MERLRSGVILVVFAVAACGGGGDDTDGDQVDAGGQAVDASSRIDAGVPGIDAAPVERDPAPGVDEPGEHGGVGCPDSDETAFTVALGNVTSNVFSGTVTSAVGNGRFYVRGEGDQEVFGAFGTDAISGAYSVEVPLFCGAQTVKLVWDNADCSTVVVYAVTTTDCTTPDLRITLIWDDIGDDWELHLIKPGGRINDDLTDCTWTSCIGAAPDWGVIGDPTDDPTKDVDNTEDFGPENILLSGPESGVYTIMVEHWSADGSPLSDGSVIINVAGEPIRVVDIQDLAPFSVWTAATIEYPGATVTLPGSVFDCTDNWLNGCQQAIP